MDTVIRACLALLVLPASSLAQDWPQWRGPDGRNVSAETDWSSTPAAEPLWSAQVGRGYSSPVLADGRLYIHGYFASDEDPKVGEDRIHCLDAASGEPLWVAAYPSKIYDNEHGGGAISTGTVHAGRFFLLSREGQVRAFDAQTGEQHWVADLVARHKVDPDRYGFSSSPVIAGDDLVVAAGTVVRLEQATGKTVWTSEAVGAHFSTVAPMQLGERRALIAFGSEGVFLLDEAEGTTHATYTFAKSERNVEARHRSSPARVR